MGVAENTDKNGVVVGNGESAASQPQPPPAMAPEEPPKMEEIITLPVLEDITQGYDKNMKFVSFEAELGSKIGDNYMSIMYAVDMELEDRRDGRKEGLKVMLKTMPRNAFRAEMINEMRAFTKESAIYQKVFPVFEGLQEEQGIPKSLQFGSWPKCYAAHVDGTTDYLAMQNLRVDGYKMGSRMLGLDFNHCSLVLRSLARYHALSYAKFGGSRDAILEAYPMLEGGMFSKVNKNAEMQQQFFQQSFQSQSDAVRDMGEELVASRLAKLAKINFVAVLGDLLEKDVKHAVVTHGDCWVNNMLFAYDEADIKARYPTSIKFLDFQLSSGSSRLVDIHYFLLTSAKLDVLGEYEEDLLRIYYSEFTSFVQMLGVDTKGRGLTWENFLKERDLYRFYGVCLGIVLAPMLAAESTDIPDMDSFTDEDFKNPEESIKTFYKDLTKSPALKKAVTIIKEHLPKCVGVEQYL